MANSECFSTSLSSIHGGDNYEWVIGIVGRLRDEDGRDWPTPIILYIRVDILRGCRLAGILVGV